MNFNLEPKLYLNLEPKMNINLATKMNLNLDPNLNNSKTDTNTIHSYKKLFHHFSNYLNKKAN